MFVLYGVLLHFVFIVALPYFLFIGILRGKYLTNLRERFGFHQGRPESTDLWIHAVSVGEVIATKPVIDRLLAAQPEMRLVVTTTTLTGQVMARRLFPSSTVTFFPFDFAHSVRRFLDRFRPKAFVTMETEIWPNVARISRERGLQLLLANGRISDRSFPRYRLFRRVVKSVLANYDRILVREEIDRQRFIRIGAAEEKLDVVGNIKFDFEMDTAALEIASETRQLAAGRPIAVLGSIVEAEEAMLLPAIETLIARGWFVILAPRKTERFEPQAASVAAATISFVRRSELSEARGSKVDLLLLDSIGELARVYALGDCAFVGGSLAPVGGHNPIEPAVAGVPLSFGPHMSNFREIARVFLEAGAATELPDAAAIPEWCERVRSDATYAEELRRNASAVVLRNRGAADRTAQEILELIR